MNKYIIDRIYDINFKKSLSKAVNFPCFCKGKDYDKSTEIYEK